MTFVDFVQKTSPELASLVTTCFEGALRIPASTGSSTGKTSFLAPSSPTMSETYLSSDHVPLVVGALGCFPFIFYETKSDENKSGEEQVDVNGLSVVSHQPLHSLALALRITALVLSSER